MRFKLYSICFVISIISVLVNKTIAQRIVSVTEKKLTSDYIKIMGDINNHILIFTSEHGQNRYFIYTYDHKMNLISKNLVHFQNQIISPFFLVYPNEIYILYQYRKASNHYVAYKTIDENGKEISTVELIKEKFSNVSTQVPTIIFKKELSTFLFTANDIYSAFLSQDKNTILLKEQTETKEGSIKLHTIIFNNYFKKKFEWQTELSLQTDETLSNFCIDNDGTIAFIRKSTIADRATLCIKNKEEDSLQYQPIIPSGIDLSSNFHLEVDNINKSFIFFTEYSNDSQSNTGLYCFAWDKLKNTPKFITKTDFKVGLEQLNGPIKHHNQLNFRSIKMEGTKGFIIDGDFVQNFTDNIPLINTIDLSEIRLSQAIIIIYLDTLANINWFKQIKKSEIKEENGIENYTSFGNSKYIYYMYTQKLNNGSLHVSIQSINVNGELSEIKDLNETETFKNGKKSIYPILDEGMQLCEKEYLMPFKNNGGVRFALIEF